MKNFGFRSASIICALINRRLKSKSFSCSNSDTYYLYLIVYYESLRSPLLWPYYQKFSSTKSLNRWNKSKRTHIPKTSGKLDTYLDTNASSYHHKLQKVITFEVKKGRIIFLYFVITFHCISNANNFDASKIVLLSHPIAFSNHLNNF